MKRNAQTAQSNRLQSMPRWIHTCLTIAAAIASNLFFYPSQALEVPLFLDTIGTAFIALRYGPLYGALTGWLTNLIGGLVFLHIGIDELASMTGLFHLFNLFAIVNAACGLLWGIVPIISGRLNRQTGRIKNTAHFRPTYSPDHPPRMKVLFKDFNTKYILDPEASHRAQMIRLITLGTTIAVASTIISLKIYKDIYKKGTIIECSIQNVFTDCTETSGSTKGVTKLALVFEEIHTSDVKRENKHIRITKIDDEPYFTLALAVSNLCDKILTTCIAVFFLTRVFVDRRHNFSKPLNTDLQHKRLLPQLKSSFLLKNSSLFNSFSEKKSLHIRDVFEDIIKLLIIFFILIHAVRYFAIGYPDSKEINDYLLKPGGKLFLFLSVLRYSIVALVRFVEPQQKSS